jgi:hypothetical protein
VLSATFDTLGETGAEGLVVTDSGAVRSTRGLTACLGGGVVPGRIGAAAA